jgi:hypothetical protein
MQRGGHAASFVLERCSYFYCFTNGGFRQRLIGYYALNQNILHPGLYQIFLKMLKNGLFRHQKAVIFIAF